MLGYFILGLAKSK